MYRKTWDIVEKVGKCVNKIIKILYESVIKSKNNR